VAVLEMTSRARRTACLCAGAVYTDVLCRCVNKRSSCVSRRRAPADHDDAGDNDVDDDVAATSRRAAATTVEPETAALSTVLATASRASRSRCGLPVSIPLQLELSVSCRSRFHSRSGFRSLCGPLRFSLPLLLRLPLSLPLPLPLGPPLPLRISLPLRDRAAVAAFGRRRSSDDCSGRLQQPRRH